MNHKIFFYLLGLVLFIACSSEGKRQKDEGGFEYQIVKKGTSETIPVDNYVFFNMDLYYKDSLIQSSSSSSQPPVLKIVAEKKDYGYFTSLINLLGKMHVGDSFHYFFPIDSFRQIPPGFEKFTEPVTYRVGILKVMDEAKFKSYSDSIQAQQEAVRQVVRARLPEVETLANTNYQAYKKGELTGQMKTTPSGLRYIIIEEGTGAKPTKGEQISVHYYGMLDSNGTMFDNSISKGQPYQFPVSTGQMIQGFDEGFMLLNKGSKAMLFIPSAIGYGAAGSPPNIPENADLIFYVELLP